MPGLLIFLCFHLALLPFASPPRSLGPALPPSLCLPSLVLGVRRSKCPRAVLLVSLFILRLSRPSLPSLVCARVLDYIGRKQTCASNTSRTYITQHTPDHTSRQGAPAGHHQTRSLPAGPHCVQTHTHTHTLSRSLSYTHTHTHTRPPSPSSI